MTPDDIAKFRSEFKSIVYTKGVITELNNKIGQLTSWDKEDSHKEAILKRIKQRDEMKDKFKKQLKGLTYDQWLEMSKKVSTLSNQLKQWNNTKAKNEHTLHGIMNGFEQINFQEVKKG